MRDAVVGEEQGYETELGVHPRLPQKPWVQPQQPEAENRHEHHRRPGDEVPQPLFPQCELRNEHGAVRLLLAKRFLVVDEQPHDVERTCEERHHEDDVQRFDYRIERAFHRAAR